MGKLSEIQDRLKSFSVEQQESDILKIMRDHEKSIVDLNRSQLLHGKDSNGNSLGEYRNEEYAAMKLAMNPLGEGRYDFRLTGSFQDKMFLQADQFPATIDSSDSKRDKLIGGDAAGEDAFGIDKENKEVLRQDILKSPIKKYYKDKVFSVR
jgi:hypothetical protein